MTTAVLATTPEALGEEIAARRPWYVRLRSEPAAIVGGVIILIVGFCAIFAPWLAPHDPNLQDLSRVTMPPMWMHGGNSSFPLGTDNLGRCVLSRILFGARVSSLVGLSVVAIGGTIGVTAGMVAGYFGGLVDEVIARITDLQLAFPFLLLAVAIVAVIGPSLGTVIIVLGVTSWVQYVRVVRAETLSSREREYVIAASATGASRPRILLRHILPNIASAVIVLATFEVARTVILESALSFLGLGAPPTIPSWGSMLADGRQYIDTAWWLETFPGMAIMLAVLGVNLFGDGLRDVVDPHAH
ncbi:MAG: ABC transporter permease [Candidatus Eremiobacteraeota bacterium]|nr:ABC transporter permease [Candidatus Eremiobacteraeota bacterium]MBV8355074.1 ABC transporter permease [Candidatus Eremiobacteraeota bacterium]